MPIPSASAGASPALSFATILRWVMASAFLLGTASSLAQGLSDQALERMEQQLSSLESERTQLEKSLEFTQLRRKSSEDELREAQAELASKENSLLSALERFSPDPSEAQQAIIANEQRRVELAEITIKSRLAAVARLERKEEDVQEALLGLEQKYSNLASDLDRERQRLARAQQRQKREMREKLEVLEMENERLRRIMEAEKLKAETAAAKAQRMAIEAERLQQERAETTAASAAPEANQAATAKVFQQPTATGTDPSSTAEPRPSRSVHKSGDTVTMFSRDLRRPVALHATVDGRYTAEVVVPAGVAYFDLADRRFRGQFAETKSYRFYYDISDPENPVLTAHDQVLDNQVVNASAGDNL